MTELDHLRDQIAQLRAELELLKARIDPPPVTSWRAAAAVLGISEDTLVRHRQRAGDDSRPWWSSPDAVREWWAELHASKPEPRPGRKRKAKGAGGALDVRGLVRELT